MISKAHNNTPLLDYNDIVLLPLCYFDIFSYPLTIDEISKFSRFDAQSKDNINNSVDNLVEKGILYKHGNFYTISDQPNWVEKRKENNERAKIFLQKAEQKVKLIATFPFVKAVFISGSLSKNIMNEGGDIDYFVITSQDRLWISRTLLIFYKKIILFNSHQLFCLNYFIDDNHLEIAEKNIFTATEIATLIPMYGKKYCDQFFKANEWIYSFLPNTLTAKTDTVAEYDENKSSQLFSWFFRNKLGDVADQFFMNLTLKYWKKKFKHFNTSHFETAFKSRSYISKHHPNNFQDKVIKAYEERIQHLESKHKINLHVKN